ncbi:membrane-spanning 4-domains, subfamily A, member 15 [Chelydra serpentina]|uniref:Membrane-spanning 4-domains, subfamily A, member 15 n=1 Tax=Chelydra serpentina TaxID=8475 RepID=A0A8T1S4N4_CHESE|nr:membrane-spanning 4-domains, subfamily A, member 15 [Chelydra serpentina]
MLLWFSVLEQAGNGISIVLLIFTILEFCIAVATALFWCRATRLNSHESMLIVPNTIRADLMVPTAELPHPPTYNDTAYDLKDQSEWEAQERT